MIHDPPLLTIRRGFRRPDPALVARFAGLPTGWVVDAMDGRGAFDHRIKPLPGTPSQLAGVALTCRCGPADNLALFGAVTVASPGDVLVAATDAFTPTCVTGDLLLGMARNAGVAGLVTDGLVRDQAGIRGVGMPVFCAGVTPNSPVRNGPGDVGLPAVLGGVAVESGDIILADEDGAVVVPQALAETVLQRIEAIRAAEQAMEAKVKAGLVTPDFIARLVEAGRFREIG
jgi:4-hydroxy-4-methyl-2-oxoglutarate aldolase